MKLAGDSLGRAVVVGILLSTAVTQPAGAQETALHGFVQANYSVRVSETRPTDPPGDFLLGDQRL